MSSEVQQDRGRGLSGARWRVREHDAGEIEELRRQVSEPEVMLRCLLNRGLREPAKIRDFLAPDFDIHRHDPYLLRDMGLVVERLRRAVAQGERILIVTDFDVDGTTSSVILTQTLRLLGGAGQVTAYIPDRFTEGYGLSPQIVERAAEEGYGIILTADIGIKSHVEARLAKRLGVDLIICDHHLPDGEDIPADAFAVLCPKGSSGVGYPNRHLAACGVALKLAEALLAGRERSGVLVSSLAKLTAIGTVADMVDLMESENRAIVAHGLRGLSERSHNAGLRALLETSQVGAPITTFDIGFKVGPRINAAGRIAHANSVLALFDARDDVEARQLAGRLDELNAERQNIQHQLVERLKGMLPAREEMLDRVLLLAGEERDGFHRGVVGIACSRIVEMTGRPTLICAINEEGIGHGSARSIDGFHIVEALDAVSDLLVKYGGHPMAAGFTVPAARLDEMRWRLNRYADEILRDEDLGRVMTADAEIRLAEATMGIARLLTRLEPHGIGNPAPLFYIDQAPLVAVQIIREKHLKLQLGDSRSRIDGLWWNAAEHFDALSRASEVRLMCRVEINTWNNRQTCQLRISDIAV